MRLRFRSDKRELLDAENISAIELQKNLAELQFINKWLGGHAISLKGLQKVMGDKSEITVCEIGCGGGDNLAFLLEKNKRSNRRLHTLAIDLKEECIAIARKNPALKDTVFIQSDYKSHRFSKKPDIIFSSLFCHHFSSDELVEQILWMKENTTVGFFINDLERNAIAYQSIWLLTTLFSNSYLVKNDAPLSVARALTKNEWKDIFKKAGIRDYQIRWQWAFRFLITFVHERRKPV